MPERFGGTGLLSATALVGEVRPRYVVVRWGMSIEAIVTQTTAVRESSVQACVSAPPVVVKVLARSRATIL